VRFRTLSLAAQLYIAGVWVAAALVVGLLWFTNLEAGLGSFRWETFAVLTVAGGVAHSFPVATPGKQAYHVSLPFFIAAAFLLDPLQLAALMVVVNVAEWLRRKRSWFAQVFNICAHVLTALATQAVALQIAGTTPESTASLARPAVLIATAAAIVTYMALNRAFVSLAIWLGNRIPPNRHYMFEPESLLTEALLLALGLPLAILTQAGVWALILGAAPLLLIHRALDLPNMRALHRKDALTQLFTKAYLTEACGRELARARRFRRPVALVVADLDQLGRVNTDHGRQAGDTVIQATARLIERATREYDVTARVDGGQFALLLPETEDAGARAVAERVRSAVAAHRFEVASSLDPLAISVSCGVALANPDGDTADHLFVAGESALADAKRAGRDRVVIRQSAGAVAAPAAREAVQASESPPQAAPAQPRWAPRWASDPERAGQVLALMVTLVALGVVAWAAPGIARLDPVVLAVMLALCVLSELRPLELSVRASYSLSTVPILAAGFLLGVPGAVVVAPVSLLIRGVSRRARWYKVATNVSNVVIVAALAAATFHAFGTHLDPGNLLFLLLPAALAGLAYYFHTAVIAVGMATEWRTNPLHVWSENFRWLWAQYVVLSAMALLLALAYNAFGLIGAAAFVVPPLMMRYVAKQYVDRTLEHVRQLRGLNDQLQGEIAQRTAAEEANARLASEAARAAALEELSRLKSEFISIASHELRTPLSTVMGFSELLLDELDPSDPRHQYVSVIHQDALQLSTLVNNLLDISRIETGRLEIEMESVDLEAILPPLITMLSAPAPRHDLVVELDPSTRWVRADTGKLNQILMNLLGNAIKYSPDGGEIVVRSAPAADGRVEVSVTDQGIGIPEEHLERIFERFHRVDSSETRSIPGTGLGLYIVRHLVELHGGTIVAESTAGRGSTFRFTLSPARPPAEAPVETPAGMAAAP
jgi:diguanylate cyclase (GGDEF)-like protein